jgi:hypothetical protein
MTAATKAQVGPEMNDVRTATGMTIHGPAGGQYFRMELRGKDTGRLRTKKKYWYRIDGVRFEFFSEDRNNFVMTNVPKALDDRVVLDLYRTDYLRRFAGTKPPNWRSAWIKLANGKTAVFWSYKKDAATPKPGNISNHEMFLVVAGPGYVFGLFAQVPTDRSETEVRNILTRTLGTLTFHEEPFG